MNLQINNQKGSLGDIRGYKYTFYLDIPYHMIDLQINKYYGGILLSNIHQK